MCFDFAFIPLYTYKMCIETSVVVVVFFGYFISLFRSFASINCEIELLVFLVALLTGTYT